MARRRVLADITPLRESADFRRLYFGQLISFVGTQLTVVAVPYQVFQLTDSSLQVGLVSLAQLGPLVVGSLVGGAIADSTDRRRILLWAQVVGAALAAGLAVNAMLDRPSLVAVYVLTAMAAALSGIERPARSAALPNVVKRQSLPAAYALWQILLHVGSVAGPALAGVLIATAGLEVVYWIDVATFAAALVSVYAMNPLPPHGGGTKAGLGSIVEGLRFLRGKRAIQGTFVIDLNAMIFGLPRAVFPAMAERVFGGGAATYGLLNAAPGAGALLGALTTGWVSHVRRQGLAVLISVALWGAAMVGFGFTPWLWLALVFLAVAGAADVVSAVFRNTILQTSIPDALRGRMSAVQIAVVTGGPRLGDAEAGAVAALAGARFSVVSGGLACVLGVVLVGKLLPEFTRYQAEEEPVETVPEPPPVSS
ncbi:MAG TPA: MFS transporter [Acidimicrobiales bacterium]|nr:MFS transporter [Acidimicrobiales bacterium]